MNRARIEGDETLIVDTFSWDDIARYGEHLERIEDHNITSLAQAEARGSARLRRAEMASADGRILVAPNCAQQLYDVISLSDPAVGLNGKQHRVVGISLDYAPLRREYEMQIELGAV